MPDQIQDSPGRKGPINHCPTCGNLLRCRSCGFTLGGHELAIETGAVTDHEYMELLNG